MVKALSRRVVVLSLAIILLIAAAGAVWSIRSSSSSSSEALVFEHDGVEREYLLHVPSALRRGAPLVLGLHGLGSRAAHVACCTGLRELANELGFVIAFPEGSMHPQHGRHWNAQFTGSTGADDVGFLTGLAVSLQERYGLDPSRTYVTGISNGGFMAYSLACRASEHIAGIAPVMALMSPADWESCPADRPVPVLHIHGVEDDPVPVAGIVGRDGARAPALDDIIEWWANTNRTTRVTTFRFGSTHATHHMGGIFGNEVWFYLIDDWGHEWPTPATGIDAAAVIADFFDLAA